MFLKDFVEYIAIKSNHDLILRNIGNFGESGTAKSLTCPGKQLIIRIGTN